MLVRMGLEWGWRTWGGSVVVGLAEEGVGMAVGSGSVKTEGVAMHAEGCWEEVWVWTLGVEMQVVRGGEKRGSNARERRQVGRVGRGTGSEGVGVSVGEVAGGRDWVVRNKGACSFGEGGRGKGHGCGGQYRLPCCCCVGGTQWG